VRRRPGKDGRQPNAAARQDTGREPRQPMSHAASGRLSAGRLLAPHRTPKTPRFALATST
jgi:hypothetical protein